MVILYACSVACICLFVTPWTVVLQAPLSMGFPRQEWWSGWPFPSPGDPPDPGIEPASLMSPALIGGFFTTSAAWDLEYCIMILTMLSTSQSILGTSWNLRIEKWLWWEAFFLKVEETGYIWRQIPGASASSLSHEDSIPCWVVCVLSHIWLFETPRTVSPSGSSVHGILQARILEWVAISSSRGSSRPRDQTCISWVSCTAGRFFTAWATGEQAQRFPPRSIPSQQDTDDPPCSSAQEALSALPLNYGCSYVYRTGATGMMPNPLLR